MPLGPFEPPMSELGELVKKLDEYARRQGFSHVSRIVFTRYPPEPQVMKVLVPNGVCEVETWLER
jgi:hypothetical protein